MQTIDLLPTILDFLDIPAPASIMGHSVIVYQNGADSQPQFPAFSERADLISMRQGRYKYIYNTGLKTGELYDLQNDPAETNNLSAVDVKTAERMQREILQRLMTKASKS